MLVKYQPTHMNVKENRRGIQECAIERHKQHCTQDTERRQTNQGTEIRKQKG
jgi:hypothetical protein